MSRPLSLVPAPRRILRHAWLASIVWLLAGCADEALVAPGVTDRPEEPGVAFVEVAPRDGRLMVRWSPYQGDDFTAFRLYEQRDDGDVLRAVVEDPAATTWVDSVFVGGDVTYTIELVRTDAQPTRTTYAFHAAPASVLNATMTADYRARISWSPGAFGANVASYTLLRRTHTYENDPTSWETSLTETLEPTDTTFVDASAVFRGRYSYQIVSYGVDGRAVTSERVDFHIGSTGHPFMHFAYAPTLQSYFVLNRRWLTDAACSLFIHRVDMRTHEIRATYESESGRVACDWGGMVVSPNGRFLVLNTGKELIQLAPLTLDAIQTVHMRDWLGANVYLSDIDVSNEGLVLVSNYAYRSPTYYGNGFALLDLNRNRLIRHVNQFYTGVFFMRFFPDGRHAFIYDTDGDGARRWQTSPDMLMLTSGEINETRAYFWGDDRYVVVNHRSLSIYEASTNALVASHPVEAELNHPSIDPDTDWIGGYASEGRWYLVYDLATGRLVTRIEAQRSGQYFLGAGTLFSSGGLYLPLRDG